MSDLVLDRDKRNRSYGLLCRVLLDNLVSFQSIATCFFSVTSFLVWCVKPAPILQLKAAVSQTLYFRHQIIQNGLLCATHWFLLAALIRFGESGVPVGDSLWAALQWVQVVFMHTRSHRCHNNMDPPSKLVGASRQPPYSSHVDPDSAIRASPRLRWLC